MKKVRWKTLKKIIIYKKYSESKKKWKKLKWNTEMRKKYNNIKKKIKVRIMKNFKWKESCKKVKNKKKDIFEIFVHF